MGTVQLRIEGKQIYDYYKHLSPPRKNRTRDLRHNKNKIPIIRTHYIHCNT